MNKLILIGNGFDLAHGMKTSYNDFILWYIKSCFKNASKQSYSDLLIEVYRNTQSISSDSAVDALVERYYKDGFKLLLSPERDELWNRARSREPFIATVKSELLKVLLSNCSYTTWVEIEIEFSELLKFILRKNTSYTEKQDYLKSLNESLSFLIDQLQQYLSQLTPAIYDSRYGEIFKSSLKKFDILLPFSEGPQWRDETRFQINRTCVLNFNYTQTAELYMRDIPKILTDEFIDIHGQLKSISNPVIFGFGDELDEDYLKMERERAKGYFDYIKSFWYFRTRNYGNLIRFIDSEEYHICVLGHSCGLSDRTMLHMIFEHSNCRSIKIFYHGDENSNNFIDITYEIARHFNDKELMRRRIIPCDRSMRMPQYND